MSASLIARPRTLTLGYLSLADVGPLEIIDAAGSAGFRSVGVRLTARRPGESWGHASVTDRTEMRRLSDSLSGRGLALSNVSTFHLYPEVTLEHLKPVIEASVNLGARTLIACLYRDPDRAAIDFLGAYAEHAGAAGLRRGGLSRPRVSRTGSPRSSCRARARCRHACPVRRRRPRPPSSAAGARGGDARAAPPARLPSTERVAVC